MAEEVLPLEEVVGLQGSLQNLLANVSLLSGVAPYIPLKPHMRQLQTLQGSQGDFLARASLQRDSVPLLGLLCSSLQCISHPGQLEWLQLPGADSCSPEHWVWSQVQATGGC